jgi:hypothetical protein
VLMSEANGTLQITGGAKGGKEKSLSGPVLSKAQDYVMKGLSDHLHLTGH